MSRRRNSVPWAATSMPVIRRQWCYAMEAAAGISFDEHMAPLPPGASAGEVAQAKKIERLVAKFAATAEVIRAEAQALRGAELYWVSRDMVDVVLEAADSLPEWTPALAMPASTGLLCWAKSAGAVAAGTPVRDVAEADLNNPLFQPTMFTDDAATVTEVAWDGVWWWSRPDIGVLQLVPCSRDDQSDYSLQLAKTTSPLWAAHSIMINPDVPRTEEANGTESAYPFVSAVGAAWLLMAQANVAETRTINDPATPRPEPDPATATDTAGSARRPSTVTIIDLRAKPLAAERGPESGHTYSHRFPVSGHWRQQACGPGHSQRKPRYIGSFIKGPEGAPLIAPKTRVHVLRKPRQP